VEPLTSTRQGDHHREHRDDDAEQNPIGHRSSRGRESETSLRV
jgi:hypothetical protein